MLFEHSIRRIGDKFKYFIENIGIVKTSTYAKEDRNFQLLYDIQPTCGVEFLDNYVKFGDGYMSCLHVYNVPERLLRNWMFSLFNKPNVIAIIDIETLDTNEVKDNINRAMSEYESRLTDNYGKRSIEKEAAETYARLDALLDEVNLLGNPMKGLNIRIFVYGQTFAEYQDNLMFTMQGIDQDGFSKYGVNLNEQGNEYQAFFLPVSVQNKTLSSRKGLPSPAKTTAFGLPFHYVGWIDPNGFYFGDTPPSAGEGVVCFDPYKLDRYRKSYDGICFGDKGSGKSTTLKLIIENQIARGNKVRIIDVTGEFTSITKRYGGIVINMDGTGGKLNPLEILRMEEDDSLNYMNHIAKMAVMFQLKNPQADQSIIDLYKVLLKDIYIKKGILSVNEKGETDYEGITGLASEVYPIFSDVQKELKKLISKLEGEAEKKESSRINVEKYMVIKATVDDIVNNYGRIFDCHTTIGNMMDADIISFDIRALSNMEDTIFDMQLFNVLTMAYDSCMDIGMKMKELWDNREIDKQDVIHHTIYIDECHKTINSQKHFAVRRMLDIMRQDRKYFIGVWLATQNIADMFPNSNNISDELKTLFSLCQYKIIFKQDYKAVELIEKVFGNQITPTQREQIPYFGKRDCLLNFDIITIQMTTRLISDEKLKYYGGGA